MEIVIVAAVGRNGIIGSGGGLPWHIPEDMARFKRLTMGHTIIIGRETFESIGRPLDGRVNVVLTTREDWSFEGVVVARSLESALQVAADLGQDAYISGGQAVYRDAMPMADRLELTEVALEPEGDTFFPEVDWSQWTEIQRVERDGFAFVSYART